MAKTFIITLTIIVDRATYEPFLPAHLEYLAALKQAGSLLLSGPFLNRTGGMVIVQAESLQAAEEIARNDPLVQNGVDSYELTEWLITDGVPEAIEIHRRSSPA